MDDTLNSPQQDQTSSGRGGRTQEVRQRAIDAYDGARRSVSDAGRRASDGIEDAPLIALAGGFAVGALIAALLPKTETETEFVRPMSKKFSDSARTAARAARDAGSDRLRELGLTPDDGRDALRKVFDGLSDAARTSADAARGAVKSE